MRTEIVKTSTCHHCGKLIAWNVTYPDKNNSHWAHAILVFNGSNHTVENARMEQGCNGKTSTWATPKRNYAAQSFTMASV
jgi:hypothetical protein